MRCHRGFPGETEDDFLETYQFISDLDISYMHVFTYSERANTPAAEMPGVVPVEERRRRNQALRGLSEMKRRAFYQDYAGAARPVLLEHHKDPSLLSGFTDNYIKVEVPASAGSMNEIRHICLNHLSPDGEAMTGSPV
jgi:threonylcarbamoyladenosine tRNA methylthiotransferase MtaB